MQSNKPKKKKMPVKYQYINREISWLSFNARVLQEAEDEDVPLLERMRFLGIFSNNRDEFFRVRVANVKRLIEMKSHPASFLGGSPSEIMEDLQKTVIQQQEMFETIYKQIRKELKKENIFIIDEKKLSKWQADFVKEYFHEKVKHVLSPILLNSVKQFPQIKEKHSYLAIKLIKKQEEDQYALLEIPRTELSRFLVLPKNGKSQYIMLIDDVIRFCLDDIFKLFKYDEIEAYAIKLTLDADFNIDDDFSKSFIEKMSRGIKRRSKGQPIRFVYDSSIAPDILEYFKKKLKLTKTDSFIPGGKYHNFKDFMGFPALDRKDLQYNSVKPLQHPALENYDSIFDVIKKKDIMLHYPYQTFDHMVDLLREAAIDPKVRAIKMTLYRVASNSHIIKALINAAKNGKQVKVVLELQARFDEENNIMWSQKLQESGVDVSFGIHGLKIHSKICLIRRKEHGKNVYYTTVGTGNFHEKTAKIYADDTLMTANPEITSEVNKVFKLIDNTFQNFRFRKLILSPFSNRTKLKANIQNEIKNAKAGKPAWIFLKMNSLSDKEMINRLYEASRAGVKVRIIVRGICCLVPGLPKISENIEVISIVDKFLEHSRIYSFCNNEDPIYLISSADFMTRNLDRRIEVTCPIEDQDIQEELREIMEIQWNDEYKARQLDGTLANHYRYTKTRKNRAQVQIYNYLKKKKH